MDIANNTTVSKLVLLYVFDKMEMPLTETTITDICCNKNTWITYMACKEIMFDLVESGFIVESASSSGEKYYTITTDGISCVSYFFMKIPTSLREEIANFIKKNRESLKKNQEYFRDYYKNNDGSYTVLLKIVDQSGPKLELKVNASNRALAKNIYKKWEDNASLIYASIYDILIDNE